MSHSIETLIKFHKLYVQILNYERQVKFSDVPVISVTEVFPKNDFTQIDLNQTSELNTSPDSVFDTAVDQINPTKTKHKVG